MQFNFVISSNTCAVLLWQRCGFEIFGVLPGAFAHPEYGMVDALVMLRKLSLYIALTMLSVIFLASPSSIMVLSR